MTFIPSNITLVSKDFYQKNIGKYKDYPPDCFVGKFIKKAFIEGGQTEYMWVKIKKVMGGFLIGEVNNDPVTLESIKCGDIVKTKTEEIIHYLSLE